MGLVEGEKKLCVFSCYHCIVPKGHCLEGQGGFHHRDGYPTPQIVSKEEIKAIGQRPSGLTIREPSEVHRDPVC